MNTKITANSSGTLNTTSYKVYAMDESKKVISYFHDIPFKASNNTYNMVCEIPRNTNAKMEIDTKLAWNPIKQDIKNGELRYVKNLFPYTGYIWNYGAIPQTWEDPSEVSEHTGFKGDGDPIDVIEIGQIRGYIGEVVEVKVLGLLAMIDGGETDWKVLAIRVTDPMFDKLNDIEDVSIHMPGLLDATREWFRNYKVPDGSAQNTFGLEEMFMGQRFAQQIINETHEYWRRGYENVKFEDSSIPEDLVPVNTEQETVDKIGYFYKK